MLEFLRHQTKPIMLTLATIIIIAFTFWGGYTTSGSHDHTVSGEDTVLTVEGRDYSLAEVQRIQRGFQIAQDLRLPGASNFYLYELVGLQFNHRSAQTGMPLSLEGAPVDYALNVIVLRNALKKYGIRASDAEVQNAFRSLGQFQVSGQFDRDRALEFEKRIGSIGMRLDDVYEVIRDSIGFQKLHEVVAGNLVVSQQSANALYTSVHQTIKAATIPFVLEDFKKTAQVTDEEISKYFDENKEAFKSTEKRSVSYVFLEKPNTTGKNAEDTVKAEKEYAAKLEAVSSAVIAPGADFDAEVKKAGLQIKTLPAFSQDSPPDAIKDEFEFLSAIFEANPEIHAVSDPVEVKNGYQIFKVTKIDKPAQQELKDVKSKVRDILLGQKASEAMQKAANDARKKLEEAVKGGKKFEDVAKEAGLKVQTLPELSVATPPSDLANGEDIAREAATTPAGAFTKPLTTENGLLIVHVISKELRKRDDSVTMKKNITNSLSSSTQSDFFRGWFERVYLDSKIKADLLIAVSSH